MLCFLFLLRHKHALVILTDTLVSGKNVQNSPLVCLIPEVLIYITPVPSLLSWFSETSNTHSLSCLFSFICHLHASEGKRKSHTISRLWCRGCFLFPGSSWKHRVFWHLQKCLRFTVAVINCRLMEFLGQISGYPHASCIQQERKKSLMTLKNKCVTDTSIYSALFYYFYFLLFQPWNVYAQHCNIHWQSTNTVANIRRHCYYTLQTKILESKRWDILTRCTIKKMW